MESGPQVYIPPWLSKTRRQAHLLHAQSAIPLESDASEVFSNVVASAYHRLDLSRNSRHRKEYRGGVSLSAKPTRARDSARSTVQRSSRSKMVCSRARISSMARSSAIFSPIKSVT